jgi:hypothetical protein
MKEKTKGGARPGAGRKKGGTNKISGATILDSVEKYCGEKFEDLLAQGYRDSIDNHDKSTRLQYEKMFLSKVVADRVHLEADAGGMVVPAFVFTQREIWDKKDPE